MITVASFSTLGHLLPMAAVVRALRARGVPVTWATGASAKARVEQAGATFYPLPERPWIPCATLDDAIAQFLADGPAQFAACRGLPKTPVLADPTMLGVQNYAAAEGLPLSVLGMLPFLDAPLTCTVTYQTTIPDFEPWPFWQSRAVDFVGPLLWQEKWKAPSWWKTLPPDQPRIIVTEGTVSREPCLIPSTIIGLAGSGVTPIVLPVDPANYPGIRAARWIPMRQALDGAACLVTNGGYGGIQTALACGVPVIVAGDQDDQDANGVRVEYSGLGLRLPRPYSPDRLREAVRIILATPRFRERALEFQSRCPTQPAAERIADQCVQALEVAA